MKTSTQPTARRGGRRGNKPPPKPFFSKDARADSPAAFFQTRGSDSASQFKAPEREKPMAKSPEKERSMPKVPEKEKPVAKAPEREKPMAKTPEKEKSMAKGREEEKPMAKGPADEEMAPAKCACGGGGCASCDQASSKSSDAGVTSAALPVAATALPAGRRTAVGTAASAAQALARRGAAIAIAAARPSVTDPLTTATTHADAAAHGRQWLGADAAARAGGVATVLTQAQSQLSSGKFQYAADDASGVYAQVQRRQNRVILGDKFWHQNTSTGRDSQAGILLHEALHAVDPKIQDHAYQSGAEVLAEQDPQRAALNADTIEYFAESAPPKPRGQKS